MLIVWSRRGRPTRAHRSAGPSGKLSPDHLATREVEAPVKTAGLFYREHLSLLHSVCDFVFRTCGELIPKRRFLLGIGRGRAGVLLVINYRGIIIRRERDLIAWLKSFGWLAISTRNGLIRHGDLSTLDIDIMVQVHGNSLDGHAFSPLSYVVTH